MLKHVSRLDRNEYEFFVIHWGQSIGRCWGTKAEGFSEIPQLALMDAGLDLAISSGFTATAGATVSITTTTTLVLNQWKGAELRLGTVAAPQVGYGTVVSNTATSAGTATIVVQWATSVTADNTAT